MDDDRELRITSGAIIGVIMLLIAMLPRDIRRDFVSRVNEMTLAQEQEERNQVMVARDAPENDDMGRATTASEGEVIDDPSVLESDEEFLGRTLPARPKMAPFSEPKNGYLIISQKTVSPQPLFWRPLL